MYALHAYIETIYAGKCAYFDTTIRSNNSEGAYYCTDVGVVMLCDIFIHICFAYVVAVLRYQTNTYKQTLNKIIRIQFRSQIQTSARNEQQFATLYR